MGELLAAGSSAPERASTQYGVLEGSSVHVSLGLVCTKSSTTYTSAPLSACIERPSPTTPFHPPGCGGAAWRRQSVRAFAPTSAIRWSSSSGSPLTPTLPTTSPSITTGTPPPQPT